MSSMNLPVLHSSNGLSKYLQEIQQFPILEPKEEYDLAMRWKNEGDVTAAHRLVTSHLRLVAKIAMSFRGYGLPVAELISEGNIGLMQAVKKFEPERGFRLSTYAMWWIKAAIQEFILRSWSLVKLGTSAAQKRLFFNLRKLKNRIHAVEEGDLHPEHLKEIATQLGVSEDDVIDMNRRLTVGDQSLNSPMSNDGDSGEWIEMLVEPSESQETALANKQELKQRKGLLKLAMEKLKDREREILIYRRLAEEPVTLEELSQKYGISRERVRQIEVRAFEKLQEVILGTSAKSVKPVAA
jgi:RNA polymerase sigma-32 factor